LLIAVNRREKQPRDAHPLELIVGYSLPLMHQACRESAQIVAQIFQDHAVDDQSAVIPDQFAFFQP
jgi:hypothetical protein